MNNIIYSGMTYQYGEYGNVYNFPGIMLSTANKNPLIAKRIFDLKSDALAYLNNKNDSAIVGITISVTADTAENNGVYEVTAIATDEAPSGGTLVKLADSVSTNITVSATSEPTSGYLKSYQFYQNGQPVGATIDIPKDFLVKSGSTQVSTGDTTKDGNIPSGHTYLDFIINVKNSGSTVTNDDHLRVDMNTLVDDFDVDNTSSATSKVILTLSNPDGTKRKLSAQLLQLTADDISATTISASTETVEISGSTVAEQLKAIGVQIKKAAKSDSVSGSSSIEVSQAVEDDPESGKIISLRITSGETGSIFTIYDDPNDPGLGLASGATWDCGTW